MVGVLQIPRPVFIPGMPSNHAASITFIATYIHLVLFTKSPLSTHLTLDVIVPSVLTSTTAALILWSRISLQYHTVAQVVAGAAVGAIVAFAWWKMWRTGIVSELTGGNSNVFAALRYIWASIGM